MQVKPKLITLPYRFNNRNYFEKPGVLTNAKEAKEETVASATLVQANIISNTADTVAVIVVVAVTAAGIASNSKSMTRLD